MAKFAPKYDVEEARSLYFDHDWSLTQIAQKLRVTRQAIHCRLTSAGYQLRPPGRPTTAIDRESLLQVYSRDYLSLGKIASHFGVGIQNVRNELRRHEIPTRPPRSEQLIDREVLETLYIGPKLRLSEVAKALGVQPETITREL